jgi:hypothetical protein
MVSFAITLSVLLRVLWGDHFSSKRRARHSSISNGGGRFHVESGYLFSTGIFGVI